jgi:putative ABC transport system permease protein
MNELRYALRQLRKSPGFTFIAILTLALGIGANTAIFSVINAVLLKPLPFPKAEQLVAVGGTDTRQPSQPGSLGSLSFPDFEDFRAQNTTFAHLAVYRNRDYALGGEGEAQSLRGMRMSAGFFEALGVQPLIGRTFRPEEEASGGGPEGLTAILSYGLWQRQFRGDPQVLGTAINLDGRPHIVVGVMPAGFQFPIQADTHDLYVTVAPEATKLDEKHVPATKNRGNHNYNAVGRLKPGVTVGQARAELSTIAAALEKQYPDTNTNMRSAVFALRDNMVGDVSGALYVLFAAVGCVLLIASANVANLLLARSTVRAKEMALRAALGASRARLVRQLLVESLLLAAIGGALGLMLAAWGTHALVALVPQNIPRIAAIELDAAVLAFTFIVALGTGIVFGLAPALQGSKLDLREALNDSGRATGGGSRNRVRSTLVVAEVALAIVLLTAAGLLLQSFTRLSRVDPGFRSARVFTGSLLLPYAAYPGPDDVGRFFDQLLPRIKALPGVESASTVNPLPLSGDSMSVTFDIEERPLPQGQQPDASIRIAGTDFFQAVGIPLVHGRLFNAEDRRGAMPVMLVNERFAEKYFPGEDIVGKRLQPGLSASSGPLPMRQVVGVVGDIKANSMSAELAPEMYLPATQDSSGMTMLVVRTATSNPLSITSAIRAEIARLDPNLPLTRVQTLEDYVDTSLARARFNATLLTMFASVAMLLTASGIYGVMAYSVAQRRQEIGIRMALGAQRGDVLRMVISGGMKLIAVGVLLGLTAAVALTRVLRALLFGVTPFDAPTLGAVALLLSLIALLACWLPARRAAGVNPLVALRES